MSVDLSNRTARCHCGKTAPSSKELPFFQYRGPGYATNNPNAEICVCGYAKLAHESKQQGKFAGTRLQEDVCDEYIPRVYAFDLFYCGCRGWD